MTSDRRHALATGVLYLVTFATAIPALALKQSFIAGDGGSVALLDGAVALEVVLALACIGTAVAFYPIGRRHDQALALGFVASRILEASLVFVGIFALLAAATVRESASAGGAAAAETALVAVHDGAFLLGPGLLPAANALLFGTLLHRARLVPRVIPVIGFIGAPLLVLSVVGTLLGLTDQVSSLAGLAALPIALWEFTIGVWLVAKGTASRPVAVSAEAPARVAP